MLSRIRSTENFNPDNTLRLAGQAQVAGFGSEIRLLVWNVYKARKRNWMSNFKDLVPGLDLIMLQEAVLNSKHDHYFENNRRHEWILARSFRKTRSGLETGVKTGSITSSLASRGIFSPHPEPITRTPKLALSTRYNMIDSADTLLVLNVHAVNFVSLSKYTCQLDQFQQEFANHHGPIILAGDFNTWSRKRFEEFRKVAAESLLEEATMTRQRRLRHLSKHLDHVFYRGLELNHIHTLSGVASSDHYPISVSFNFNGIAHGIP